VVVVVVVVVEVGATVVVVVALGRAAAPVEPAAPPPDEFDERTAKHTVSPINSGVVSDAELRRNNRVCGTLKRAERRDHESFANTRCVEVHCGDGFTLSAGDEAMFEALAAEIGAINDEMPSNTIAIATAPRFCPRSICLLYKAFNRGNKLE
jgi:hypothetical protein